MAPEPAAAVNAWPVRLLPGDDLRLALQSLVVVRGLSAAFVLAGIGSLSVAQLRLAGAEQPLQLVGDLELLGLAGSVAANGVHLHMSVADADGRVLGGHVAPGCVVRTTAEVLLQLLPSWDFRREADTHTGWAELAIRPRV
jgi:predicted DNA-binding protein with PD1-like motif